MPRIARIIAPGSPHHLQIWAWCLMSNQVHLLAVPETETETSLARGIGLANQMHTRYINRKLQQSGRTLLKAGVEESVADYRWSSAKVHVTTVHAPLLSADSWFSGREQNAYRDFVCLEYDETDSAIRKATNSGRPSGSAFFIEYAGIKAEPAPEAGQARPPTQESRGVSLI